MRFNCDVTMRQTCEYKSPISLLRLAKPDKLLLELYQHLTPTLPLASLPPGEGSSSLDVREMSQCGAD